MSRIYYAIAPTMLLAAGGFAGTANAAQVFTDTFAGGLSASTGQDVNIGMDLLGHANSVSQYSYGLKSNGESGVLTAAFYSETPSSYFGAFSATSELPDAGEQMTAGISFKGNFIPVAATIDGTNIPADDTYLHLRFDIEGQTYLGSAHFDVSDHTVDGAKLLDVSYAAAPAPEPATWAEMIGGLGAIGGSMRAARRRKAQLANA